MQGKITVVPAPRKLEHTGGSIKNSGIKILPSSVFAGITRQKLKSFERKNGLPLRVEKSELGEEEYTLEISESGATIRCSGERGAHYAALTLAQILGAGGDIPCVKISDAPDFPVRGLMYDISRNRVPTLETLKRIVDILSDLKINMLQLYVEGRSFYYESEREFYDDPDDFLTPSDVRELKAYAAERFVELVPCGNSLGHMAYWLSKDKYKKLAYCEDGFEWWEDGLHAPPCTLDPKNPKSKELVFKLFDGLLGPYGKCSCFNIGGDEPFDMLFGKKALDDGGKTYFEFISDVCENVRRRGITPMMWGDVAHKYPERFKSLGDVIFLEWRYEAGEFTDEACAVYKDTGAKFFVCPSSSLCSDFTGKTDNMLANMSEAAHFGKKYGAAGYLNTEWGDGGSSQSFVSSVYGFGVSACHAWNADVFDNRAIDEYLDKNIYGCKLASLVADLGRYVNCQEQYGKGVRIPYLFSALYIRQTDGINRDRDNFSDPAGFFWRDELLTKRECDVTEKYLNGLRARFDGIQKDENDLFVREVRYCLDVLDWALAHTRLCLDLKNLCDTREQVEELIARAEHCVAEHGAIWALRNKKSDYALASYRFKALAQKYKNLIAE